MYIMKKLNFVLLVLIFANVVIVLGDADHDHEEGDAHEHDQHGEGKNEAGLWLASVGSIFAISLCGIFGVLVIPIMQKVRQM